MRIDAEKRVLLSAEQAFSPNLPMALLRDFAAFVRQRLASAENIRQELSQKVEPQNSTELSMRIHTFLGNCWEALDGVGRLINLTLYPRFSDSGLRPPDEMSPQCTFYTVRRDLHRHHGARDHPVTRLMWNETKTSPRPSYGRLSLLYHVSRYVPVGLQSDGQLPGYDDMPAHIAELVRPQDVNSIEMGTGLSDMLDWERSFISSLYAAVAEELEGRRETD